ECLHQDDEELLLRGEVKVETSGGHPGLRGDFADRNLRISPPGEQFAARFEKLPALLDAPGLARIGWPPLACSQRGTAQEHGQRRTHPPPTAPPQKDSIQPPKIPAAAGSAPGNRRGKKTHEIGSRIRVGSISRLAAANQSGLSMPRPRQIRG